MCLLVGTVFGPSTIDQTASAASLSNQNFSPMFFSRLSLVAVVTEIHQHHRIRLFIFLFKLFFNISTEQIRLI